jgi:hypothetical protein
MGAGSVAADRLSFLTIHGRLRAAFFMESSMTIPASWLPAASMQRVICHWTAGNQRASTFDAAHYHLLIEGDGNLVRGLHPISANAAPIRGNYAAHTRGCNTGSIGVSLACMRGAQESPFDAGPEPMTVVQWNALVEVLAALCTRYGIKVTPKTVLSHAEVQDNLGIAQRSKWDYTRLPFAPELRGARAIGDTLRREIQAKIDGEAPAPKPAEPISGERGVSGNMELRGVTTAGVLNFRREPDGEVIGSLPRGTAVSIVDVEGEWYRARSPAGYLGWVHGRYVALDA